MLIRTLSLGTLALLGSLAGAAVWLSTSESGLQAATRLAGLGSGGRLHIEQARGRLLGPLELGGLQWKSDDLQVQVEALHLAWTPRALLGGQLQIAELTAGKLRIDSASHKKKTPPPADLGLPLRIELEKLSIARLEYGAAFTAQDLSAALSSRDGQFSLRDFRATTGTIALTGAATLGASAPLQLTATAELTGQLEQHPLALALRAEGPLEKFVLDATARAGVQGQAKITVTPFAAAPFADAKIALDGIDPAAWQAGAPRARIDLRLDLKPGGPAGDDIAGRFSLTNRLPGPLDRQRLPLLSLSGQLAGQGERARFEALRATLPGQGELTGRGRWEERSLQLDLEASRLDAAQLVSTLRPTRLHGPLSVSAGAERQALKFNLRDARFTLLAEASHAAGTVTLPRLELAAGDAKLAAKGELALAGNKVFSAEGTLTRFDPSRFVQAPTRIDATLNATFNAEGRLEPRLLVGGRFKLQDSRLADQPLSGEGRLNIDWPRIPQLDLQLAAGTNRLQARGAWGRPGDALRVDLDAPQLAPFGLEGGLSGQLDLAGDLQRPKVAGRLDAARLGLPGSVRVSGLSLTAAAAGEAASPLRLELRIAQLDTPARPALLKALQLQGEGRNQAHRLRASADLHSGHHLTLVAEGGLLKHNDRRVWEGQLQELRLVAAEKSRNVVLAGAAPLKLGSAGWSFGPAQFQGEPADWRASLAAEASRDRLHATLSARGQRIGVVDGQLNAAMDGPWSLRQTAPWQASLSTDIADLGWLSELIGEQWQSEGRLKGELNVAGTPARPQASGRFRGERLGLRLKDQGLNLTRGELAIDLDNNLLRVSRLSFDSLLQPMPRPLRLLLAKDEAAALTAQPGRIEISGEMQVDSQGADSAFLDFTADRLGAFQLPDQWIAVSGSGRLTWRDNTFGAKGKLAVDAGYWQLAPGGAPRLSEDVVVKRPGPQPKASGLRPKMEIDLSTDLGRRFLFSGAGLNSRLVGDIRLRASGRDLPRASGSIRTRDGRFDAYGQKLAIERGILTFQGLLDNPALDVRAVRQGLPVEAGVQLGGTARRPVVKLISDPELPDAEKLAWLVLGHGPEQMSASDATVLLSAAGGLLGNDSGGVIQQLKTGFGIDELGVRTGQIGDAGARQPGSRVAGSGVDTTAATGNQILSVGKRLSSRALLSYEQTLGKAESIVKLTVNLSRQFSLIGRAGSDNALDLFYTLSFGRD